MVPAGGLDSSLAAELQLGKNLSSSFLRGDSERKMAGESFVQVQVWSDLCHSFVGTAVCAKFLSLKGMVLAKLAEKNPSASIWHVSSRGVCHHI